MTNKGILFETMAWRVLMEPSEVRTLATSLDHRHLSMIVVHQPSEMGEHASEPAQGLLNGRRRELYLVRLNCQSNNTPPHMKFSRCFIVLQSSGDSNVVRRVMTHTLFPELPVAGDHIRKTLLIKLTGLD